MNVKSNVVAVRLDDLQMDTIDVLMEGKHPGKSRSWKLGWLVDRERIRLTDGSSKDVKMERIESAISNLEKVVVGHGAALADIATLRGEFAKLSTMLQQLCDRLEAIERKLG